MKRNLLFRYLLRHEVAMVLLPIGMILLWPQLVENFFNKDYMPHGHCYMWMPNLVWLHVSSDLIIGLAYVSISVTLGVMVYKARKEIPFHKMFLAFGLFIITCGFTHFMAIWTLWEAVYWISGSVKLVTAAASVVTAVALPFVVPKVIETVRASKLSEERKVEIEKVNKELETLNEQLRSIHEAKTNFFMNVSHELRTPLSLILGPSENMLKNEVLTTGQSENIKSIKSNALMLLKYVDDLLDIAKMEVAEVDTEYSRFDFSELVRSTGEYFSPLATSNRIEFSVDTPNELIVEGDKSKLNRVLLNLVSNAFKYVTEGGFIRCRLKKEGDVAQFEIEDSGKGVGDEDKLIIFEKYRRGKSAGNERTTGTGLGLAIAKEFVDLHKGKIEVVDAPSGGALFRVEIPLQADTEVVKTETGTNTEEMQNDAVKILEEVFVQKNINKLSSEENPNRDRPKIMLVEDNYSLNNYITRILNKNYLVYQTFNGKEGLKKAKEIKPDLIITDYMMPEMDGDKMIEELKLDPELKEIPVILLTANKDDDFKLKMLKEGAQDYLHKPFTADELAVRVDNLIQLKLAKDILQTELESKSKNVSELLIELIEKKEEVEISLKQKENLLKEVHHRVKNNIQIIISLMNLQHRYIMDERMADMFNEIRSRIKAMSLVHEILEKPEDINRLSLRRYVGEVVASMKRLFGDKANEIIVTSEIDDTEIDIETGLNIGLILNELLLDSFNTLISEKGGWKIRININSDGNELTLRIIDDGRKRVIREDETLGMVLVDSFVQQMEGEIDYKINGEREVIVKLKI